MQRCFFVWGEIVQLSPLRESMEGMEGRCVRYIHRFLQLVISMYIHLYLHRFPHPYIHQMVCVPMYICFS